MFPGSTHARRELSSLSKGYGLLDAGVEVQCFADNRKAFSLQGQSLLAPPGPSSAAHTLQPYRTHTLALPKTYVTRRGQMVLFTAPEDMIIGQPCRLHHKSLTTHNAADKLKTTTELKESVLKYDTERDSGISDGENASIDDQPVSAGHFTHVYLKSLQDMTQKAKQQAKESLEQDAKDLVKGGDSEIPLASDCDSGIGPHSDGASAVITVPDGNEESQSVSSYSEKDPIAATGEGLRPDWQQLLGFKPPPTAATPSRKKKSKKTSNRNSESQARVHQGAGKERKQVGGARSQHKPASKEPSKSKRKHRKTKESAETTVVSTGAEKTEMDNVLVQQEAFDGTEMKFHISSIQTESDDVRQVRPATGRRSARMEEKRTEIERKRREKQELEAQKRREEEERERLLERLDPQSVEIQAAPHVSDDEEENIMDFPRAHDHGVAPTPSSNRQALYAELEQARLRERRLMLAYRGEDVEKSLSDELDTASAAIAEAQHLRAEVTAQLEATVDERLGSREEEEAVVARQQVTRGRGAELQREHNYRTRLEPGGQKRSQSISRPFVFSYFRHVPPPSKPKPGKKSGKKRPARSKPAV